MNLSPDLIKTLLEGHERLPHRAHQLEGVKQLVWDTDPSRDRVIPKVFYLADEVGAGKTKQVVDASQILYLHKEIDTVLVLAPGYARSTWADEDPTLGEVAKHAWESVPNVIHEYHKHYTDLDFDVEALHWVVSNYEFIRRESRRNDLLKLLRGRRVWFVMDEAWALKGFSDQMRACRMIRNRRADRVVELNGTPLSDGKPEDLFYPMGILDPNILEVNSQVSFQAKWCVMAKDHNDRDVVVDYKDLDTFNRRIAPYVLSRRTRDCFDLPPMLDPIVIEARLSPAEWDLYRSMKEDMVAWLGSAASVSRQAITKALRLSQITSGFLGGLEEMSGVQSALPFTEPTAEPIPQWLQAIAPQAVPRAPMAAPVTPTGDEQVVTFTKEIGRAKLDAFLHWLQVFPMQPHKLLVWSRFTPELERTTRELHKVYDVVLNLRGNQTPEDRAAAKALLAPGGDPRRGAVVGNQKAGGASLNFAAANIAVYLSNGPALIERTQSIGRIERPGATQPMLIVDVVAVGPKGQKTIDHHTLKALREKDDMARWTVEQWRKILRAD